MRTVPQPSACPGWYVSSEPGAKPGFTSDPAQARQVPVCTICDDYHPGPEGGCLL